MAMSTVCSRKQSIGVINYRVACDQLWTEDTSEVLAFAVSQRRYGLFQSEQWPFEHAMSSSLSFAAARAREGSWHDSGVVERIVGVLNDGPFVPGPESRLQSKTLRLLLARHV